MIWREIVAAVTLFFSPVTMSLGWAMTPYEQQLWRRMDALEKEVAEMKRRFPRYVHGTPYYWGVLDGEDYSERLVVLPERY